MALSSSRIIGGVVNMMVVPSAAVDEGPHIHHRCIRRADDSTLADHLWARYLLPLHLISALVFTAITVSVINDRNYAVCDNGDSWWRSLLNCGLAQSDVTSLISAALVLIRLVTSAWFTVPAWRVMYILLEKRGMPLAQMSNMVMFHWPGFCNSLGSAYTWLTAALYNPFDPPGPIDCAIGFGFRVLAPRPLVFRGPRSRDSHCSGRIILGLLQHLSRAQVQHRSRRFDVMAAPIESKVRFHKKRS
jgi:hypothetical protein